MNRSIMLAALALAALSFACDDLLPDSAGSWEGSPKEYLKWTLVLTQDDVTLKGTLTTSIDTAKSAGDPLAPYLPTQDMEFTGNIATDKVLLTKNYTVSVQNVDVPITLKFDLTLNEDNTKMTGTCAFVGLEQKVPESKIDIEFTKK